MKINQSIQNLQNTLLKSSNSTDNSTTGVSFGEFLNSAINEVNSLQLESEKLNQDLALGLTDNIHQVMIASEKAGVALQFTMQIRNKVMDAYQEIMRMPI